MATIMKTPTLILLIGLVVIAWQRITVSRLDLRTYELRQQLASLETTRPASGVEQPESPSTAENGGESKAGLEEIANGLLQAAETENKQAVLGLFARLTSPEAFWAVFERVARSDAPEEARKGIWMLLLQRLAKDDPAKTVRYLSQEGTPLGIHGSKKYAENPGFMVLNLAMAEWAKRDEAAARAWFERTREQGDLDFRLNGSSEPYAREIERLLIAVKAKADPLAAIEQAVRLEQFIDQIQAMKSVVTELRTDAEHRVVISRIASIENVSQKVPVYDHLSAHLLADRGFQEASDFVSSLSLPYPDNVNLSVDLVRSNTANGMEEKMRWLLRALPEDRHAHGVARVFERWAVADFNAAAKWLNNAEKGPVRDAAVEQFAHKISQKEPEAAIEWARSIGDEQLRESVLRSVLDLTREK